MGRFDPECHKIDISIGKYVDKNKLLNLLQKIKVDVEKNLLKRSFAARRSCLRPHKAPRRTREKT